MKTNNPFLKQLISEIANKATEGRIVAAPKWNVLNEGKRKKIREADDVKKDDGSEDDSLENDVKDLPTPSDKKNPADKGGKKPFDSVEEKPTDSTEDLGSAPETDQPSDSDVEDAQADANEKKAELEKAKAEKDKAEQELEKNSYIKLNSTSGVQYLLAKILDHAFKSNSIDALASEMVQKLKIQTPEDFQLFSDEVSPYKILPNIGELLASMKMMATKQSKSTDSED